MPKQLDDFQIADGEAYHRALYHNGDLNHPADWHRESVKHLIDLTLPHIHEGALVVDYGSGTGGSAIELLKVLDERDISIELVLMDPLISWFGKARELLGHRDDVHFELSILTDDSGNTVFRELGDVLSGRKADVIISSSTLHLIPISALGDLARQFSECLSPNGVFVWDSGDVECDFRPKDTALLHDPYRAVRKLLRDDDSRQAMLAEMAEEDAIRAERRVDRIFPVPFSVDAILDPLTEAGFTNEVTDHVVEFSNEDAERFILVPRLAEIAAPLMQGKVRDDSIREVLSIALSDMRKSGCASTDSYRSHWVYGLHSLMG